MTGAVDVGNSILGHAGAGGAGQLVRVELGACGPAKDCVAGAMPDVVAHHLRSQHLGLREHGADHLPAAGTPRAPGEPSVPRLVPAGRRARRFSVATVLVRYTVGRRSPNRFLAVVSHQPSRTTNSARTLSALFMPEVPRLSGVWAVQTSVAQYNKAGPCHVVAQWLRW